MTRKQLAGMLLSLCLMLALIPAMAFAEAAKSYTITYSPGAYGTGSIAPGIKTHGVDFTLTRETFTRENCVQIGWALEDGCYYWNYKPGDSYSEDEDVTLYPVWEERITMTVPYTTTVALGGGLKPGRTDFALKLLDSSGNPADLDGVQVSGLTVTTDGAGSWNGTLAFSGLNWRLWERLDGIFVQQVDAGGEGWDDDPAVWFVALAPEHDADEGALDDAAPEEAPVGYKLYVYPAYQKGTEYGWDWKANPVEKMTFTNTYTKSAAATPAPTNPGETTPVPDVSSLPQTGDSSSLTGWLILLAVSAAGVTACCRRRKGAREK